MFNPEEQLKPFPYHYRDVWAPETFPKIDLSDIGPRVVTVLINNKSGAYLEDFFTQKSGVYGIIKDPSYPSLAELQERINDPNISGLIIHLTKPFPKTQFPTTPTTLNHIAQQQNKPIIHLFPETPEDDARFFMLSSDLALERTEEGVIKCLKCRTIRNE